MYCPPWIFDICVARTASEFLYSELSLTPFAVKYSKGLSSLYETVETKQIEIPAEGLLLFLTEIQAGESAADFLRQYTYFKLYFETNNVKRKLKPMFGSIEDPVKNIDFNEDKLLKISGHLYSLYAQTLLKFRRPLGHLKTMKICQNLML